MQKLVLIICSMMAFLWVNGTEIYAQTIKIGVIDIQKVFEESSAGKQMRAEINKRGTQMEEDLKAKSSEIETLNKNLERESAVINKEQKEKREREINIKVYDLKALKKKYNEELLQLQQAKLETLKKDLFSIVKEIGEKEGYTMILERIGVLYYQNAIDITDMVVEKYNAKVAK